MVFNFDNTNKVQQYKENLCYSWYIDSRN